MKKDSSHILTIRAIASTYARQLLMPPIIIAGAVATMLWGVLIYAGTTINPWWWVLALPLGVATIVGGVAALTLLKVLRTLSPPMNARQTQAAREFVERTGTYAGVVGMSRYMIAWTVIRQVVLRRDTSILTRLTDNSSELAQDYRTIHQEFAKRDRVVVENTAP
jgi:hypothetical protein